MKIIKFTLVKMNYMLSLVLSTEGPDPMDLVGPCLNFLLIQHLQNKKVNKLPDVAVFGLADE